ncbi:Transcription elongation factor SPT4 [Gossypium arboreum]|uniref:Transcription elongation factor SPT4 n=1 Tax=Gossypium arboreum TaxID=29729 RepID=A0A0B0NFT5_GOSAR|nr:Transcription elongation factor SPT4 [Gossypium arboreum]
MENNHLLKYYCKCLVYNAFRGNRENLYDSRAAGVDGGLKSGGEDSW